MTAIAGTLNTTYTYDNNGNMTDETGAVVERLSYDAWGKRRYASRPSSQREGSLTTRGFR